MEFNQYKQEVSRLISYNKLSEEQLQENKEKLDEWLQAEYGECIANNLMLHSFEPMEIDLNDGLYYTLDSDCKLICHGFKKDFVWHLTDEVARNETILVIADKIVLGDCQGVNFNTELHHLCFPFVEDIKYIRHTFTVRSTIDILTLGKIQRFTGSRELLVGELRLPSCRDLDELHIEDCQGLTTLDLRFLDINTLQEDLEHLDIIHNCNYLRVIILPKSFRGSQFSEYIALKYKIHIQYV